MGVSPVFIIQMPKLELYVYLESATMTLTKSQAQFCHCRFFRRRSNAEILFAETGTPKSVYLLSFGIVSSFWNRGFFFFATRYPPAPLPRPDTNQRVQTLPMIPHRVEAADCQCSLRISGIRLTLQRWCPGYAGASLQEEPQRCSCHPNPGNAGQPPDFGIYKVPLPLPKSRWLSILRATCLNFIISCNEINLFENNPFLGS